MWATGAARSFFGGFDNLPLPPGRKGCLVGLLVAVAALATFLAMAYLFSIGGVVVYAAVVLILTWRPLTNLGKSNRAREAALQQEKRSAAAGEDTDFRLH